MLIRRIQRQRSQLVINLPAQIARDFDWRAGDYLKISVVARGIIQLEKISIPSKSKNKKGANLNNFNNYGKDNSFESF